MGTTTDVRVEKHMIVVLMTLGELTRWHASAGPWGQSQRASEAAIGSDPLHQER